MIQFCGINRVPPEWTRRQVTTGREWEDGCHTVMNKEEQIRGSLTGSPLEVTPEDFPWVFVRGRKPSQIISTLEALAVLLSLRLFATRQPEGQREQSDHPSHMDRQQQG